MHQVYKNFGIQLHKELSDASSNSSFRAQNSAVMLDATPMCLM